MGGKLLLSIIFGFICLTSAGHDSCPPASQITPCICSDVEYIYSVECRNITNMETLVGAFDRSGDRTFANFALSNSTVMYLPAHSLSQKKFSQILLMNVTLASIFDVQPDESNQLDSITIINSRIYRKVEWEYFRSLKQLMFFRCENTEIKKLGKSFAENVNSALTNLILIRTKTAKLHDTAFERLTELFHIEITDSEIKSLKRTMFARPSKLEEFNFSGNQLQVLDDDIFSDMPNLKKVFLERNKITTISEAVFGEKFNILTDFNLTGNPIICDCKIKWIVTRQNAFLEGTCGLLDDKTGRSLSGLNTEDFRYCS